jgi:organic hydroperoxide reductase OsmC/OhrA
MQHPRMDQHPFPHHYRTSAHAATTGDVTVAGDRLPDIATQAPPEFGGPPGYWSPETLLTAAVADCFILSFRAVARASKVPWVSLAVDVEGVLERVERVTKFTRFVVSPRLTVPPGTSEAAALEALHRAERVCLVTNSLSAASELAPSVLFSNG